MKRTRGGAPRWPLVLLVITYLVSPTIATNSGFPTSTPICHGDATAFDECDWPLFESPSAATVSSTASLYYSGLPVSADSSTIPVTAAPTALSATSPTKPYTSSTPSPSSSPSPSAAPSPVIREAVSLPRNDDDQVPKDSDNEHRVGSSKNLTADAPIDTGDNDFNTSSNRNTSDSHFVRNGSSSEPFAEQGFSGRGLGISGDSAYRRSLLASIQVHAVVDVVIGPFYGYALDFGLTEVPVGWTPEKEAGRTDEEAETAGEKQAELSLATQGRRDAGSMYKAETAKAKASREADEEKTRRMQQWLIDNDELERKRQMDYAALVKHQKTQHEALMQSLQRDADEHETERQRDADESEAKRQREHKLAIAEAKESAARSDQATAAALKIKEHYEHLACLLFLALVLLASCAAIRACLFVGYGLSKWVKFFSRRDQQPLNASLEPPVDGPPPPDAPAPPRNDSLPVDDDQTPPDDGPQPPDAPAPPKDGPSQSDNYPTPAGNGHPPDDCDLPSDDVQGDDDAVYDANDHAGNDVNDGSNDSVPPSRNVTLPCDNATPLSDAQPVASDDTTVPSDDPTLIDRGDQQKEVAEGQPEVDMSMEAIRRRIDVVIRRNARLQRNRAIAAPTSPSSFKRQRPASSGRALSCEKPVPFHQIVNSYAPPVAKSASDEGVSGCVAPTPENLARNVSSSAPAVEQQAFAASTTALSSRSKDTDNLATALLSSSAGLANENLPAAPQQPKRGIDAVLEGIDAGRRIATQKKEQKEPTAHVPLYASGTLVPPLQRASSPTSTLQPAVTDAPGRLGASARSCQKPGIALLKRALDSSHRPAEALGMGEVNDVVPTSAHRSIHMREGTANIPAPVNRSAPATSVRLSANSTTPAHLNRSAPPSVRTSVNSVATGAHTRPVNANRVSQAGPRVSYATTASQSLSETHNQGPVPPARQNVRQAAQLPGRSGDAKLPKIDADAPPRVHNPKYYFEDGGKKPHRSKRGSGINKKALRAEEARLRLEAELAGNGLVGSGGAGDGDVGLESDESSEDEA